MSLEERVMELEVRLTHQDHLLGTLDGVVREFAERVTALEAALARLTKKHEGAEAGDAPPPHY